MSETTKHLLREAIKELGSLEELAIALRAPAHLVQAWMNGHATMPDRKLLLLIDVLEKKVARADCRGTTLQHLP